MGGVTEHVRYLIRRYALEPGQEVRHRRAVFQVSDGSCGVRVEGVSAVPVLLEVEPKPARKPSTRSNRSAVSGVIDHLPRVSSFSRG